MKAFIPGGRFDPEFETNEIHTAIAADLTNPVGTSILWYVYVSPTDTSVATSGRTVVDPVYDVGSYTTNGSGGRKWRDPVQVPVVKALLKQGRAYFNMRGFYAPDTLHLTLDRDQLMQYIPDVLDNPDPLDRDRVIYKGQVYRPFLSQQQGIIKERYVLISFDCQQVMPEEMQNDPQFQSYAQ